LQINKIKINCEHLIFINWASETSIMSNKLKYNVTTPSTYDQRWVVDEKGDKS